MGGHGVLVVRAAVVDHRLLLVLVGGHRDEVRLRRGVVGGRGSRGVVGGQGSRGCRRTGTDKQHTYRCELKTKRYVDL